MTVYKICEWPDGVWCDIDDLHEFIHKSDDYDIIYLTEDQYEHFIETGNLP